MLSNFLFLSSIKPLRFLQFYYVCNHLRRLINVNKESEMKLKFFFISSSSSRYWSRTTENSRVACSERDHRWVHIQRIKWLKSCKCSRQHREIKQKKIFHPTWKKMLVNGKKCARAEKSFVQGSCERFRDYDAS